MSGVSVGILMGASTFVALQTGFARVARPRGRRALLRKSRRPRAPRRMALVSLRARGARLADRGSSEGEQGRDHEPAHVRHLQHRRHGRLLHGGRSAHAMNGTSGFPGAPASGVRGGISLRGASFRFPRASVLSNANLEVPKGGTYVDHRRERIRKEHAPLHHGGPGSDRAGDDHHRRPSTEPASAERADAQRCATWLRLSGGRPGVEHECARERRARSPVPRGSARSIRRRDRTACSRRAGARARHGGRDARDPVSPVFRRAQARRARERHGDRAQFFFTSTTPTSASIRRRRP